MIGWGIRWPHADNLFRTGIDEQEFPVLIGHHHAIVDAVENSLHEVGLSFQLADGFLQLGLLLFMPGNVAKDDHAGFDLVVSTFVARYESPLGADIGALRLLVIANKQLHGVCRFTLEGTHEGKFFGWNPCFLVEIKGAVCFGPFLRS